MKLAKDVGSSVTRILSDIETIFICPGQADNVHAGTVIRDSVLEKVEWDHPPNFPRRPADDPVLKELLRITITEDRDPYISRIARQESCNLPYVYIRG